VCERESVGVFERKVGKEGEGSGLELIGGGVECVRVRGKNGHRPGAISYGLIKGLYIHTYIHTPKS